MQWKEYDLNEFHFLWHPVCKHVAHMPVKNLSVCKHSFFDVKDVYHKAKTAISWL